MICHLCLTLPADTLSFSLSPCVSFSRFNREKLTQGDKVTPATANTGPLQVTLQVLSFGQLQSSVKEH